LVHTLPIYIRRSNAVLRVKLLPNLPQRNSTPQRKTAQRMEATKEHGEMFFVILDPEIVEIFSLFLQGFRTNRSCNASETNL